MFESHLFLWLFLIIVNTSIKTLCIAPVKFGSGLLDRRNLFPPDSSYESIYHNLIASSSEKGVESFFKGACECGKERSFMRIVGGTETMVNQYPWMTGVFRKEDGEAAEFLCGGTLISSHYVVTASHCVSRFASDPSKIFLMLGDHNISSISDTLVPSRAFETNRIILHPLYNWHKGFEYDIALVRLRTPIQFESEKYIRPICLPDRSLTLSTNLSVTAVGWGYVDFEGGMSDVLRHVVVKIVDKNYCRRNYKSKYPSNEDSVICAGDIVKAGRDTCQGDSGGPLMFHSKISYYLVGVTSAGSGCGDPRYPGIYTNLVNPYIRSFVDLSFLDFSSGYPVRTCHENIYDILSFL